MLTDTLKGGKSTGGSTPTQADDSLSSVTYAQVMDLVSEGPIFGPPDGVPEQAVYLNDVPLMNADGTTNFNVKSFDFRYGEIDQAYISGFDSSSNETSVGVELKQVSPWSVVVSDMTVDALVVTLGVNSLSQTNTSNGDVTGYEVKYQIQLSVDGAAYQVVVDTSFNGKASSTYQRSHRIALSGGTSQYMVRVVRTTADTTSVYIQDTTTVVSYAEVVDAKLRYPLSAVCALSVDAVQFSSIPTRSYDFKGLLIKYPSNYNPTTRTYTGTWDGTFTTGWTDNPAWIFYDLVLNTRYGAGQWVDATMIDRYALYQIAQYCDVMVSDGAGGTEPRFTCNCYIQSRADAFKVLQDLASVFRGMAYWGAGAVEATADMPSDPVYVYTAANVIGGQFKYVGSSLKTRYTAAVVTWNDPANAYKQALEYVEDVDGILRYGLNKAQITAFGCTSRGQAQRVGHWSILTSRYETNAVTFSVGLDGTLAQPGQIIAVADPARSARRMGGRLHSVNGTNQVTLDKALAEATVGDTLTVVMPSGVAVSAPISAINGAQLTVTPAFATVPQAGAVWMIESSTVQAQLFRVHSVAEQEGITFELTCTQHEPAKYAAIDDGAAMDVRPVTGNTFTTQLPPTGVTVTQYVVIDQGIAKTNMSIGWQSVANGVTYSVQWQKDNGTWVDAGTTGGVSLDVGNIYSGSYLARVKATNGMGISSVYAFSAATTLAGKTGTPPAVATLTATANQVFAVNVAWTFPTGAADTAYTEIYYSHTSDFASAVQQGRYSYPTNNTKLLGLASGYDLYFWARLVDTTGNVGPWYPTSSTAGVHGASSSDATAILSYLTGQITQTQLGQDVLTPIQAIPALQTTTAANTAAIAQETTDRTTAIAAEASARATAVTAEASARADAIAAEALARGTAITTEQNTRSSADSALSTRIDTVTAANGTNAAAITSEATTRASADTALGTRIDAVVATAAGNTSAITSEATTRATADSAMASDIALLGAHNSAKSAFILNQSTVQVDASTTLAQKLTSLSTADNNNATAITTETTARTTADSALGTRIDNLSATVSSTNAAITAEQTARATGDTANATAITSLTATVAQKNTTFRQAIQPVGSVAGDTWVDTGSTNLFKYSQQLDNTSAWLYARVGSVSADAVTAPDGTQSADTIAATSTAPAYLYQGVAFTSGSAYTLSVYAKAGTASVISLQTFTQAGACSFTLTGAGSVGAPSGIASSPQIVALANGWYRCSVLLTATATGTNNVSPAVISTASATATFWGAQIEQLTGAGRYIPTTTASVSTVGNNSLLVWDGTQWVLSQDAAIPANTAAINTEASTRATADSALGTRIDNLTATVSTATAAITSEATTRASADSALSTRVDGVYAQLNPAMAGDNSGYAGSSTVYAGVWSEQSARAEADLAQAQKTDTVSAQLQTTSATLSAAIQTESTARATADSAQAALITTVQAQAASNAAAVQTVAQSYADLSGQLSASYTIKTQVTSAGRTYIAGIGIGVNSSGGVVESQVLVSASTFSVIDPNGTTVSSPFTIVGGQTYINQAFIGTGWITNAMIGQTIQSTAVGANGQPLWILDKSSGITFNGPNGGSGYLNLNSSTLTVYDGNGVLRVRLGIW